MLLNVRNVLVNRVTLPKDVSWNKAGFKYVTKILKTAQGFMTLPFAAPRRWGGGWGTLSKDCELPIAEGEKQAV